VGSSVDGVAAVVSTRAAAVAEEMNKDFIDGQD
jgi:hypothetical protein